MLILGTVAGWVSDIRVDDEGRMFADVRVEQDFYRFVRQDSTAVIKALRAGRVPDSGGVLFVRRRTHALATARPAGAATTGE